MNKKSLLVTLITFTLVSCGSNGKMPKITEERAIELANEIIARQDDSQVFAQPKNFVYKYSGKTSSIDFNSSGKTKIETTYEHIFEFDLDKLVCRDYEKNTDLGQTSEIETIDYYDNAGFIRHLENKNGYKTRRDDEYNIDTATSQFENWRSQWKNTYTWNHTQIGGDGILPFALSEYTNRLSAYQEKRELYKNEKDQYCKIYVGSSNAKALQTIVDVKEKRPDDYEYSGYSINNYSTTIKNDLFASCSVNSTYDLKLKEDGRFYSKGASSASSSMTYGNAKISIPNYMDYKLVEN